MGKLAYREPERRTALSKEVLLGRLPQNDSKDGPGTDAIRAMFYMTLQGTEELERIIGDPNNRDTEAERAIQNMDAENPQELVRKMSDHLAERLIQLPDGNVGQLLSISEDFAVPEDKDTVILMLKILTPNKEYTAIVRLIDLREVYILKQITTSKDGFSHL